ncbi:MAG: DNA-protecting protein DprA, partial [Candidatus Methylumidiphilus sp.]
MSLPAHDLRFSLALLRAPKVGPRTFKALLRRFGTPAQVFAAPSSAFADLGLGKETREWLARPDWRKVDADLRWLDLPGHHCLPLEDEAYPAPLREIADPPPLLFVA